MTDVNEFRDLLHYPDDDYRVSAEVVIRKARRKQRVRATAAAGVSLIAAGLTAWSVWPLRATNRQAVSPPAVESPAAPAPTLTAAPEQPTVPSPSLPPAGDIAKIGTAPVDLGEGWSVWLAGTNVCVQGPAEAAVDCRSTSDGTVTGVDLQTSKSASSMFFRAVIPYDAARVVLTFPDSVPRDAQVYRLEGVPGWAFYALHVSAAEQPNVLTDARYSGPTVTAYDSTGQALGTLAAPPW
jgi:hypothetical protein